MRTPPLDYPVSLRLDGQPVLVVGGGPIALGRVRGLLEAGARVTVVALEALEPLRDLAARGLLALALRAFDRRDVLGQRIVLAATNSPEVNHEVVEAARARGLLANAADLPALCDFTLPAIGRRGALCLAVTSGGQSPTAAKAARDVAMAALGPEYGALTDLLGRLRPRLPRGRRARGLASIVEGGAARLLAEGDRAGLFGLVRAALNRGPV